MSLLMGNVVTNYSLRLHFEVTLAAASSGRRFCVEYGIMLTCSPLKCLPVTMYAGRFGSGVDD
ncbi:MAG: hypothetical protein CFH35_01888 [Alphaproteobacteria bacterium MarineAlpha9_Bin5]|jgi:hypothetical protein|nr:MAG: hypothetical protein CFH36_02353 [Alphaproteobacteria bacterium MarineAlpha9_Bin6]PPR35234.1 MAG: hypothetical protein CFH35_01888 [Alphaproteobacteria bacterium MarineAlpha9_Bin5]